MRSHKLNFTGGELYIEMKLHITVTISEDMYNTGSAY